MTVNFTKNQEEITQAWRKVVDSREEPFWALFGYEGTTNNIKLMSTGSSGLGELVQEFNCSLIQYALCRIVDKALELNKLVLINWQGDASPLSRKGICASHVGDVANYFKGCSQTITIRNDDEATPEYLMEQVLKTSNSYLTLSRDKKVVGAKLSANEDHQDDSHSSPIGSTYKKTDIMSDISTGDDRKSFWARLEEEEKKRIEDEKKRAIEKQAQFEKERKSREEFEAKKLAEAIRKRDEMIQATRHAEKLESTSSGNSSLSSIAHRARDDELDERVGRRSELIRLERNQETQSLISKGLIKNKRAIFEQASQQTATNQPLISSSTRNRSGNVVSKRINSFRSMNSSSTVDENSMKNLSNSLKKLNTHEVNSVQTTVVKKEVEDTHTTKEDEIVEHSTRSSTIVTATTSETTNQSNHVEKFDVSSTIDASNVEKLHQAEQLDKNSNLKDQPDPVAVEEHLTSQNQPNSTDVSKSNGTAPVVDEKLSPKKDINSPIKEINNGIVGITAKALYDYQAADNTEISFDPDDVIGYIQKVDKGWWHGSVISGQFKGQSGLFPANYVEELTK